ncbi:unnamed protein product [Symbiodinium sp. CCMP2456]|nr:unnamed protein product [Symbiodinium sp. CCMP2456]
MSLSHLKITEITVNSVISACEKGLQWQRAESLLFIRPPGYGSGQLPIAADTFAYNSVMSAYEECSLWMQGLRALSLMSSKHVRADVVTFTSSIGACEWEHSYELLHVMPGHRIVPNVVAMSSAISSAEKGDQWELALCTLALMLKLKVSANDVSFNSAIIACARSGKWELALHILDKMMDVHLAPDLFTGTSTVWALETTGEWQQALDFLRCMPQTRAKPNVFGCASDVNICERDGDWQKGLRLINILSQEVRNFISRRLDLAGLLGAFQATAHLWELFQQWSRTASKKPKGLEAPADGQSGFGSAGMVFPTTTRASTLGTAKCLPFPQRAEVQSMGSRTARGGEETLLNFINRRSGKAGPLNQLVHRNLTRRMLPVQDASQAVAEVKSINEFTDSLAKALAEGDGIPSKELTRELLADGLRRALEIGGEVCKKRFLETLAANIHKFALQEQYSLSRVYPVEISSEYRNLQSFFIESATEGDAEAFNGTAGTSDPPALSELRRRLGALPQKPGPTSEELVHKFKEEQTTSALKAIDVRARAAFFAEVRLNLFRFSETAQKELVETFTDLKAEVVKLVDSTTQEVAAWLDEERVAVAWRNQAKQATLLAQVKALFQAVQSPPFQATFRHLTGGAKRAKEAFLLQAALCLKKGSQNNYWDQPELSELAGKLRRSFFYVEGYGELMDDWLQSRVKKLNEDFLQRAVAMLGNSLPAVLTRLRQIFRPGRWIFLCDPRLESDLINLFDEDTFPRHVLTSTTITQVLERVPALGGDDFHIYNDIVRSPPLQAPLSSGPMDLIESALMEVLRRLPGFPPLLRLPGPGHYRFGRVEVLFQLAGTDLAARVLSSPNAAPMPEVLRAVDFFVQFGPQEFPNAAVEAVQSSDSMHLCPTTGIQDVGAPLAAPGLIRPPMSFAVPPPGPPTQPLIAPMAVAGMAVGLAPPAPVPMIPFVRPKFGIDDDEI